MRTITFTMKELQAILWAIDSNRKECEGQKAHFCYCQTEMDVEAKIVVAMAEHV